MAPSSGTATDFEFFARGAGNTQVFTPEVYSYTNGVESATPIAVGAPVSVAKGAYGAWYVSSLPALSIRAGTYYDLVLVNAGADDGTYVGSEQGGPDSFFVDYAP